MADRSRGALCRFLILILMLRPVIASPQFWRRDESLWDSFWPYIIDSLGAASGVSEYLRGLWAPETPSKEPPGTMPDPRAPAPPAAPIDPATPEEPQATAESSSPPSWEPQKLPMDAECGEAHNGFPDGWCNVGTRKIIYTRDCWNQAQNAAIAAILAEAVQFGEISTSIDNNCGILFWTGQLTEERAKSIREIYGVLAVVNDILMNFHDTSDVNSQKTSSKRDLGQKNEKKPHFEKRDTLVTQPFQSTSQDLTFISTPPGKDYGTSYSYFSAAGEGVTVYVVDSGLNPFNSEFSSGVVKRWLYAWGSEQTESDDNEFGHGSCSASKVAGVDFGVAKKASLIVVKIGRFLSSALDGLILVLNDLRERKNAGEYLPGYNVVNMQAGVKKKDIDKYSATIMKALISNIINKYGVVFVCAAGNGGGEIDALPPTLSPKLPIIVVGAVDLFTGKTLASSKGGSSLTVSAPGWVVCAGSKASYSAQVLPGTSFAAPAVAGLVAYFLSLHDLGPILRERPRFVSQAVKQYIVDSAYVRSGGTDKAIWNKIDPDAPGPDYGWIP